MFEKHGKKSVPISDHLSQKPVREFYTSQGTSKCDRSPCRSRAYPRTAASSSPQTWRSLNTSARADAEFRTRQRRCESTGMGYFFDMMIFIIITIV